MQRGENGKKGSKGQRMGVSKAWERKGEGEEEGWNNLGEEPIRVMYLWGIGGLNMWEKNSSELCSPLWGMGGLIMWEGGGAAEVRDGEVDLGEEGLASEGSDKQEDKNEEEGEVPSARVPHMRVGAAVGGM
jgi:hypothetical protein